ncbi:MAG: dUTP diphosphatase [archaeon]
MRVLVQKIDGKARNLEYAHEGDSGIDLFSTKEIELKPLERQLVPTGIRLEMPLGLEAQIRPKSGLAINHGITLLNSPGTIDSSYRGEIKVIAINLGNEKYVIEEGQKIAQMVFAKVEHPELVLSKALGATTRNEGGFGSTGLK